MRDLAMSESGQFPPHAAASPKLLERVSQRNAPGREWGPRATVSPAEICRRRCGPQYARGSQQLPAMPLRAGDTRLPTPPCRAGCPSLIPHPSSHGARTLSAGCTSWRIWQSAPRHFRGSRLASAPDLRPDGARSCRPKRVWCFHLALPDTREPTSRSRPPRPVTAILPLRPIDPPPFPRSLPICPARRGPRVVRPVR